MLEEPSFPDELRYLWGWWTDLSSARGAGMSGPSPITYRDVDAYARLTGQVIRPVEVRALMQMDAAFRHPGDWEDGDA